MCVCVRARVRVCVKSVADNSPLKMTHEHLLKHIHFKQNVSNSKESIDFCNFFFFFVSFKI